jgi:HPr kinase/phosphorylase
MSDRQESRPQSKKFDPTEYLHASALVVGETGVLIRGPSGSGKSTLVLALLALAHDRGLFACLIGDDRVSIQRIHERIVVDGARNVQGLIERRGVGILTVPVEPSAILRLVIDLLVQGAQRARMPEEQDLRILMHGINVARMAFETGSAPADRALAVLERLDRLGHKNVFGLAHFA